MSVEAIAWVLRDAPDLKPNLVAPLIGLANHADPDGRGAYPAVAKLAWYARKSTRQIQADLTALLDAGLITVGDQRFTAHMPADRRPTVYDLAMHRRRDPAPAPGRPGRPRKISPADGGAGDGLDASADPADGDADAVNGDTAAPGPGDGPGAADGDDNGPNNRGAADFTPDENRGEVQRQSGRSVLRPNHP